MKSQEIVVKVGMGVPSTNDLMFNFHFNVQHEQTVQSCWIRVLSYAQINKIDSQITANTDKINHTIFPNLTNDEIKNFIEAINGETNQATTSQFNVSNLGLNNNIESTNSRLLKILTLTKLIEDWMHMILMRLYVMPYNVIRDILHITCLPYGPQTQTQTYGDRDENDFLLRTNLQNLQSKKGHDKRHKTEQLLISKIIEYERKLESSSPPLLKVSVTRSGIFQKGKLLYKVSHHSPLSINVLTTHYINNIFSFENLSFQPL